MNEIINLLHLLFHSVNLQLLLIMAPALWGLNTKVQLYSQILLILSNDNITSYIDQKKLFLSQKINVAFKIII